MENIFVRSEPLLGIDGLKRLQNSRVLVFGLGGVGGALVECLARSGVGLLVLVDNDTVSDSNRNRQIIATSLTVGQLKTQAWKERILSINPDCKIELVEAFVSQENANQFDYASFDYVADAIDTVSAKIAIAEACFNSHTPLISCLGTGNKLDPTRLKISDLYTTSTCPLARVMRRELKKRGVTSLPVCWSDEEPISACTDETGGRHAPASVAFVPPVAGYLMGAHIVKSIVLPN